MLIVSKGGYVFVFENGVYKIKKGESVVYSNGDKKAAEDKYADYLSKISESSVAINGM